MFAAERDGMQKRVTITSKRQFTIPQKFYSELGFGREAICTIGKGFLVIQPVSYTEEDDFAEQILSELIAEGYTGAELLSEFKTRKTKIRPAVEDLLEEAKAVAEGRAEYMTYSDVFDSEE